VSKEQDIILAEYQCLREEIVTKMNSSWQILTFETGGTSLILGFVFANQQYILLPLIPFLILVSSFLHLGETSAIINAGEYIRTRTQVDLQKILNKGSKRFESMTWEDYVWEKNHKRPYDWIHITTVSLFAGMFTASIILMIILEGRMRIPSSQTNIGLFILLLSGYIVGFGVYLYQWIKLIKKKTTDEKTD
jgi:hypothetical protein